MTEETVPLSFITVRRLDDDGQPVGEPISGRGEGRVTWFTATARAHGSVAEETIVSAFGRLLNQVNEAAQEFRDGFAERMAGPIRITAHVGEPVREIEPGETVDG